MLFQALRALLEIRISSKLVLAHYLQASSLRKHANTYECHAGTTHTTANLEILSHLSEVKSTFDLISFGVPSVYI